MGMSRASGAVDAGSCQLILLVRAEYVKLPATFDSGTSNQSRPVRHGA
jgi:hypothetical protein